MGRAPHTSIGCKNVLYSGRYIHVIIIYWTGLRLVTRRMNVVNWRTAGVVVVGNGDIGRVGLYATFCATLTDECLLWCLWLLLSRRLAQARALADAEGATLLCRPTAASPRPGRRLRPIGTDARRAGERHIAVYPVVAQSCGVRGDSVGPGGAGLQAGGVTRNAGRVHLRYSRDIVCGVAVDVRFTVV